MPVASIGELFGALGAGDVNALIDTPEAEWVEFKSSPYRLNENDAKLELAKDVAGMANAGGGAIVVGCATAKDASTGRDVAKHIRRVPCGMVDFDQHVKA